MKIILETSNDTIIQYNEVPIWENNKVKFVDPNNEKKTGKAHHKWNIQNIKMYVPTYNGGERIGVQEFFMTETDIETIYKKIQELKKEEFISDYDNLGGIY